MDNSERCDIINWSAICFIGVLFTICLFRMASCEEKTTEISRPSVIQVPR